MSNLFENDYLLIRRNNIQDCLEIIGKNKSNTNSDFEQSMKIISDYIYYTKATKIVFLLKRYNNVGNDNSIMKEFLPELGLLGVKHIAVVTGSNEKTQVFFEELINCTSKVNKYFDIESKHFETMQDGIHWIENQ